MTVDRLTGTDLAAMHQAIVETSAAAFPGVHFEFYRQDRKNLPFGTGAADQPPKAYALLELSEMEPGDSDPGTEQQAVAVRFEAEIVIKSLQDNARLLIRVLAGSYAAFLRRQLRWPGVLNGPIRAVGCYKDDFSPELDQFEVWRVEWTQDVWLGAGVPWVPPAGDIELAEVPQQVLYSFVPLVGVPYEPEYRDIAGVPRVL